MAKNIHIIIFGCLVLWASALKLSHANNEASEPINTIIKGSKLVDQQTTQLQPTGSLKAGIIHRFGPIGNGIEDIFGVFGPANLLMWAEYTPADYLALTFATEKQNRTQELGAKLIIMQQSVSGSKPISLALYSSVSIDARDEAFFGEKYQFTDRLFYSSEIITSRQFGYKWFVQLAAGYYHFNSVGLDYNTDKVSASATVSYNLFRKYSVFGQVNQPFDLTLMEDNPMAQKTPVPTYALGLEKGTRAHSFQVYIASGSNLSQAKDYLLNESADDWKNLRIGFTIHFDIIKP